VVTLRVLLHLEAVEGRAHHLLPLCPQRHPPPAVTVTSLTRHHGPRLRLSRVAIGGRRQWVPSRGPGLRLRGVAVRGESGLRSVPRGSGLPRVPSKPRLGGVPNRRSPPGLPRIPSKTRLRGARLRRIAVRGGGGGGGHRRGRHGRCHHGRGAHAAAADEEIEEGEGQEGDPEDGPEVESGRHIVRSVVAERGGAGLGEGRGGKVQTRRRRRRRRRVKMRINR
jgi:hypothetical protein